MANTGFNINSFFNTLESRFDSGTKEHLKNVYSCLSMTTLAAAVGGYVHLFTDLIEASFLTTILGLGLLLALLFTPDNGKNHSMRLGFLLGFAFLSGLNCGPLLEMAIHLDPSIIPSAFLGTAVIFICFTLSSLYTTNRYWLYMGGTLSSGLSILLMISLASIFIRSQLLFQVHLYLGLFIMCGFIMYDTQLIVEKRRHGDKDYIRHSLDLFIDMIDIFRRLVIILSQKEQRNKRKSN